MLCPQATTGYLYITTTLPLSHPSSLVLLPLLSSRLWQLQRIIPHVGWLFSFIIHFEESSVPVCAISDLSWHKRESCQGETKHFFLLFFLFHFCHCQWYSEMVQCCYGYSQGFLPGIWKAVERKWKCWQNESLSATPLLFFKGQSVLTVATESGSYEVGCIMQPQSICCLSSQKSTSLCAARRSESLSVKVTRERFDAF